MSTFGPVLFAKRLPYDWTSRIGLTIIGDMKNDGKNGARGRSLWGKGNYWRWLSLSLRGELTKVCNLKALSWRMYLGTVLFFRYLVEGKCVELWVLSGPKSSISDGFKWFYLTALCLLKIVGLGFRQVI